MEDYYNNQSNYNKLKNEYERMKSQEILYKKQIASLEQQNKDFEQKVDDLQKKLNGLQDLLIDYTNRQEKAQNIIESTQNLKQLESQRLQLLYKKWEDLSAELQERNVTIYSLDDLLNISSDFRHALKVIVEDSTALNDKSYAKSVLTKMAGTNNSNNKLTKKYVARSVSKKHINYTENIFEEELTISQQESAAEKFLNGEQTFIPKSMGVGKEVLSIPPKEQKQEKKEGFSLEEALTPKESLSEIMSVFKLDD